MKKLFFLLCIYLIAFIQVYGQKRPFTIADLYKVRYVGAPAISNDGQKVAFTITVHNMEKGKSNSDVYVMDADGSNLKQLTYFEGADYNPFWSPDDKTLYFISTRSGSAQLFALPMIGGEAKQITDISTGLSEPVVSPNGKLLAFVTEVFPECETNDDCNKKINDAFNNGPLKAHMGDDLLYRHWDSYKDGRRSHIFIYNFENETYTDVTPGDWDSPTFSLGGGGGFAFSPDSKELCFMSKRVPNPAESTNSDLWLVSVDGGNLKNITRENAAWDGHPVYSPDGKYIAYLKQLIPGYESDKFRIALYNRSTGESRIITESFDNWVNDFVWSGDSRTIYFNGDVKGYSPIYKIDISSEKIEKVSEDGAIFGFQLAPKNDFIIYNKRSTHEPAELYKFDLKKNKSTQLTFENKTYLEEVDVRPAEQIWVDGADGKPVHVFVVKPHNFNPNKKYPLILNVHGGPQSQWMDSFRGDWQVYPGAGYIVAFANPHGSTGYGQQYTEAISGDWGGKVFEDLMKVTDALEELPYVDKDRIGAMGWSYGGYMMNWFQAKTKRFKCLVSMMGVYDLKSMFGTTEELWFVEWDLKGQPWNSEDYIKWSPSNYVENFSTPTLIITGKKDYRVSYNQSVHYFTDLQKMGVESRIIIFQNDGHWPSMVRSMPFYYNAHLDWFHKYLGGDPAPYDMTKMLRNLAFE